MNVGQAMQRQLQSIISASPRGLLQQALKLLWHCQDEVVLTTIWIYRLHSSNVPNIKSHYLRKVREQNRRYIGVLVEGQYSQLYILSCSHWSYRETSFPSNFTKF